MWVPNPSGRPLRPNGSKIEAKYQLRSYRNCTDASHILQVSKAVGFARAPEVRIEGAATLLSCLRRGASRSTSAGRPSVRGAAAPDRLISQSHNKIIEQRPHRSDFLNCTAHHHAERNVKTMGPDALASGLRFRRQLKVRRPQGTRITAAMSRGMKSWWSSMNMEAMRNSMAMMPMIGRSQPTSVTPPVPAG